MAESEIAARDPLRAQQLFNSAEKLGASAESCAAGRWTCAMLLGHFEEAWRQSEYIQSLGVADPHRLWQGESVENQCVILRCLHGYGDTIQFIRYAGALRGLCRRLVVEADAKIVPLLRRIDAIDEVITWGKGAPAISPQWDLQIEITELPRVFRTTLDDIPSRVPYMAPNRSLVAQSQARWRDTSRVKVGFAWKSGEWNESRSLKLQKLAPLFALKNLSFYSLQWRGGPELATLPQARRNLSIIDLAEGSDFTPGSDLAEASFTLDDAAAAISQLDLILSVDTVVAHLAGALAKPVWTMLPFQADWRWMLDRVDTPWYPTMRLFRQPKPGDWDSVVASIGRELSALSASAPLVSRSHSVIP